MSTFIITKCDFGAGNRTAVVAVQAEDEHEAEEKTRKEFEEWNFTKQVYTRIEELPATFDNFIYCHTMAPHKTPNVV